MRSHAAVITRGAIVVAFVASSGCHQRNDAATRPTPLSVSVDAGTTAKGLATCPVATSEPRVSPMPPYIARLSTGTLFVRTKDGGIGNASASDNAVLHGYPTTVRGPSIAGLRITLLASKSRVAPGEEVRVIHVVEAEGPGKELFVMGPKPVVGEYVDGKLVTPPVPSVGAFTTEVYDGAVLASPGVDTNFDLTRYTFAERGMHTIEWRDGAHRSNALCIDVE